MEDKFSNYYILIDIYDETKEHDIPMNSEPHLSDENFFKWYSPFNMSIFFNYLRTIIFDMCDKFKSKEKVREEIKSLYNEKNNSEDYKWKNISLKEMIKGEYSYLREIFILKEFKVPDNDHFINNYCYPMSDAAFPFSLKELYTKFLERGINIAINNYYCKKSS